MQNMKVHLLDGGHVSLTVKASTTVGSVMVAIRSSVRAAEAVVAASDAPVMHQLLLLTCLHGASRLQLTCLHGASRLQCVSHHSSALTWTVTTRCT